MHNALSRTYCIFAFAGIETISTNFCQPTMDFVWQQGNENFQFNKDIFCN